MKKCPDFLFWNASSTTSDFNTKPENIRSTRIFCTANGMKSIRLINLKSCARNPEGKDVRFSLYISPLNIYIFRCCEFSGYIEGACERINIWNLFFTDCHFVLFFLLLKNLQKVMATVTWAGKLWVIWNEMKYTNIFELKFIQTPEIYSVQLIILRLVHAYTSHVHVQVI